MRAEDVKAAREEASKRPPGQKPGEVLRQRRSLPYSPVKMAVAGFFIATGIAYVTLYIKKKRDATAVDVAKVTVGVAKPEDTHPRK
ncbi:uncharacterized protein LOC122081198 [Macadamia integrifolia]|uniref:uncharacterized protein LOC122081198 n=1 Tax=Macadamia integrifolia TaxID=60698 RepID=UPI001C4E3C2A|nr:uncharacterized protein LOC122081198 [Macadamia integrifolia]